MMLPGGVPEGLPRVAGPPGLPPPQGPGLPVVPPPRPRRDLRLIVIAALTGLAVVLAGLTFSGVIRPEGSPGRIEATVVTSLSASATGTLMPQSSPSFGPPEVDDVAFCAKLKEDWAVGLTSVKWVELSTEQLKSYDRDLRELGEISSPAVTAEFATIAASIDAVQLAVETGLIDDLVVTKAITDIDDAWGVIMSHSEQLCN